MTASPFDPTMLLDPAAFPWPVEEVRLIETHISWVYLAGERVVKLKRPVELGFVDFRDPARRKQACLDEVRLNQRLTTDVYLGVVPVTASGVDGQGEPLEWVVVMRRLPAERMLDRLLQEGAAPDDLAERLAERLLPFHGGSSTSGGLCPQDPETYLKVLTDNLAQVAEVTRGICGPAQLAFVDRSMRGLIEAQADLLEARFPIWLREGHGDLRCEHICLERDAMQIYDCVEFEIAIRCADVASDLAFLLMDLRRLGAEPVGAELLKRYRAAGFDLPQPVVDLYGAHRALVRAKVAALERSGKDADADRSLAFEAGSYLDIATSFACPIPPMLVLVSGLSGSGKSTVAGAIGRATNGVVLSSDRVRKELAGLDPSESAAADWHQGIYTSDWTARTYERLLELACETLTRGQTAIVDATFLDNEQRERFVGLCGTLAAGNRPQDALSGCHAIIVWTELDDAIARERIERRARERNTASDATFAIWERQVAQLAETPVSVPDGALAVTVDTGTDGPPSLDAFFLALDEAGLLGTLHQTGAALDA